MILLALVALALALAAFADGVGAAFAPRRVAVEETRRRGWGGFVLLMALTIASACVLTWLRHAQ